MTASGDDLLDRILSRQEIGELPARYAMALDARDLDTLVGLFAPDVEAGRFGTGRDALRSWYDVVLRRFGRSIHLIAGVVVDFDGPDDAHGHTYCRAEHESEGGWYVMAMRYDDVYRRQDGRWCFVSRREKPLYAVDVLDRPSEPWVRWPGKEFIQATMPTELPSWQAFWDRSDDRRQR